jgi:hypothetical protein
MIILSTASYGKSDVPCTRFKVCAVRFRSSSHPSQHQRDHEPGVGFVNCLLTVMENGGLRCDSNHNQLSKERTYRDLAG